MKPGRSVYVLGFNWDVERCGEQGCVGDYELFVGVRLEYGDGGPEFDDGVGVGSEAYVPPFLEVRG